MNPTDILKDVDKLLKGANALQKQSTTMLDDVLRNATPEQKEALKPVMKLQRELNKATGKKDATTITEILSKLQNINAAGITNTD